MEKKDKAQFSKRKEKETIYGINPAFEVLKAGKRKIYELCLSNSASKNPRIKKLVEFAEKKEVPVKWMEKGALISLCGTPKNQGVVLVTSFYPYVSFESLLDSDNLLLLDNVEDPHNVGAILRSAESFGFKSVLLSRRGVPDIYSSVVKVSAGASEHVNVCKSMNANQYVRKAAEEGYKVIVLDVKGDVELKDMAQVDKGKYLLVIGGEDKSVGQFIINSADYVVRFNQMGEVNSLNASVAAGVAMYALS